MMSIVQQNCQVIEPLTHKTWWPVWVVLVWVKNGLTLILYSFHNDEKGNVLFQKIATTVRIQLAGWNLLFGEYLHTWTFLYLLDFPINIYYRDKLNIEGGKHVLARFKFRNYFKWMIKQLLNAVSYHLKTYGELGGCYPPRPMTSGDNTLLDLRVSSDETQPHSIMINKYCQLLFS